MAHLVSLSRHRTSFHIAVFLAGAGHLAALESTSVVLSNPANNPSMLGQNVTVTATVTPSTATGKVTFYDGTALLGTNSLVDGQVTLSTSLLGAGPHSLRAYYGGDSKDSPSTSSVVPLTVQSTIAAGFQPADHAFPDVDSVSIAIGDFNGDGKADLAVIDQYSDTVTVLRGNGDGTFETGATYPVGSYPYSVGVADFNGDGKADLVVANGSSNDVSVLLGNGDGTFQAAVKYATGKDPRFVAVGDFNGDGNADLVVANSTGNNVSVLLGKGNGTFAPAVDYPTGTDPQWVAIADFNGDGTADLAVANSELGGVGNGNVSVLLGKGDGTFESAVEYPAGMNPVSVAVADFNGDGKPDIAAGDDWNSVSILLNAGNGTFDAEVNYPAKFCCNSIETADVNGDGKIDLVGTPGMNAEVTVLLGNGDGTFQAASYWGSGALASTAVAVGQFNGNGMTDLAIAPNVSGVFVLLGTKASSTTVLTSSQTPSVYGQSVTLTATVSPSAATGSVTYYDGVTIIGTAALRGGQASLTTVLLGPGTHSLRAYYAGDSLDFGSGSTALTQQVTALVSGGFEAGGPYMVGTTPGPVVVGDFNGDGKPDLAVANTGGTNVSILLGNGDGTFGTTANFNAGGSPVAMAIGDFNGDGYTDLALVNSGAPAISILIGNGDGTFRTPVSYAAGTGAAAVAVADFNGDGIADLATANGGSISILFGNGDGTFQTFVNFNAASGGNAIAVGNFSDASVGSSSAAPVTDAVSVLPSNGDGTFLPAQNYTAGTTPVAIVVGDFNGDGAPDLAVANAGSMNITVLLGGRFESPVDYPLGVAPSSLAVADVNGEGRTDLVVTAGGSVLLLPGNGDGTFANPVPVNPGVVATSLAVGDFNRDGIADLAVTSATGDNVAILLGQTPPPTGLTLMSSQTPSTYGQNISLTATITPSTISGSVTFYDGATMLGSAVVVNGQAVFNTSLLATGARPLRAVYVANASGAASSSVVLTQTVTPVPQQGFEFAVEYGMPNFDEAIAVGDFNGDGKPDLVTTGGDNVSVLLNKGDGSFLPAINSLPDNGGLLLAVGDFNGDGKADVVITSGNNEMVVLLGHGDGTFRVVPDSAFVEAPQAIVVGDFNSDGKADLATANSYGTISVLLGNGDGTFQPAINFNIGGSGTSLTVGDFNGDGKTDLAVTSLGISSVSVLLGNGNGTFSPAVNYAIEGFSKSVATGDFNGDGYPDLAVANFPSNTVSVLLGNGDGTFQSATAYTAAAKGSGTAGVVVGDFNGDGIVDLAVSNASLSTGSPPGAVSVLAGNGNGTFQAPVIYSAISSVSMVTADFTGDGLADIALASNYVILMKGLPIKGTTPATVSLGTSSNPSTYGQDVTLTATVTPPAATGEITFYDGVNVLGVGVVANGAATFTTSLLISGTHSLTAYFGGNTIYAASASAQLAQTVNPIAESAFLAAATFATGSLPQAIAVADFNKDGKMDVATANLASINILPGNGDGTLGPAVSYGAGGSYTAIGTGDFNGDGNLDVVAADVKNSELTFLFGNGDGTFQPAFKWYSGGEGPLVVGDFNGDGFADIAVASAVSLNQGGITQGNLAVMLGNGDGTFAAPVPYETYSAAVAIAIGDFNGDGKPDLAVALNSAGEYGGFGVLFGNGDGTFQPVAAYLLADAPAIGIAVGDFNGDGIEDLATTIYNSKQNLGAVAVLPGSANGLFLTVGYYAVNGTPQSIVTADFNGDGNLDAAVGCQSIISGIESDAVCVLYGNGDGTLQTPLSYATASYAISMAAADFNGDGRVDLATVNYSANATAPGAVDIILGLTPSKTTLMSSGSPSVYGQPVTLTASVTPSAATGIVTFLDGTTVLGTSPLTGGQATFSTTLLASGTGQLQARYGGDGTYGLSSSAVLAQIVNTVAQNGVTAGPTYMVGSAPQSIVSGDFNGDGIVDFAVTIENGVSVLLGNGDGTFQAAVTYAASISPYAIAIGDFNGDGKTDLILAGGGLAILSGKGDGTFEPANILLNSPGLGVISVAVADFNGDGKADATYVSASGNSVNVMLGNGDGTFRQSLAFNADTDTISVAVGDFNGDGKPDLAVANFYTKDVSVLFGKGDGTFKPAFDFDSAPQPTFVAVADFNGDGKADIVTANRGDTVNVLLNQGTDIFETAVAYPADQVPLTIVVNDFNGDGIADLAVANNGSGTVSILTGNGSGGFSAAVNYAAGNGPTSLAAGDFNGDGRADLAVVNYSDGTVSILLGAAVSTTIMATTELRVGSNPIIYRDQETLTALVSPSTATGSVTFLNGAAVLGTGNLSNGVATLTTTAIPVGVLSLTARYDGDGNDAGSVSAAVTLTVTQATTTTTLASSANPSSPGEKITLTASVASSAALTTATGSITFSDGLTPLGTVPLSAGKATLSVSALPAGTNTLIASYSGDTNDVPSTARLIQTVGKPTTTTTSISSSANPSIYGQSLTLTATVTSPISTGMVTFYDGMTMIGTGTLASGQATLKTQLLASGSRSLRARYDGDFTHLGSLSPVLAQTVRTLPASGFEPAVNYGAGTGPWSAVVADFNGDGNMDLAVTDQGGQDPTAAGISVLLGNGDGTFQPASNVTTVPSPGSLVAGDFNDDGIVDLAYSSRNSAQNGFTTAVLLGRGDGTFHALAGIPAGGMLAVGDFNEDGIADIVAFSSEVNLLFGNGDGTFYLGVPLSSSLLSTSSSGAVGDFNNDGHADLAVTTSSGAVVIYFGAGNGTFEAQNVSYSIVSEPSVLTSVAVGDFNGDGYPDLAVESYLSGTSPGKVNILLGEPKGVFQNPVRYTVDSAPQAMALGDFNGDGVIDIATADSGDGDISVLPGNGNGTFQTWVNQGAGIDPQSIVAADFNGDGRIDFVVANSGSSNVSILLGNAANGQAISFAPLPNVALGTAPFTVSATANSGLTVTLASNTPAVCGVSGTTVTLVSTGTCSITATQAGNSSYAPAPPVTQTFIIGKVQTITFGALKNQGMGAAPFALQATASSKLPVTFASNSTAVCTVSNNRVTMVAAGTCSITASQPGNSTWGPATPVTQMFTVAYEAQTITFGALAKETMGAAPFALKATATSKLPVTFASNSMAVCTVADVTVTLVEAGTCSITASQPGNAVWAAATSVTQTFTVASEPQTIKFNAPASQTLGMGPVALTATATSGLTVTFVSTSPTVCTISGANATLVAGGTCAITASQTGNLIYAAAPTIKVTFTVLEAQTINFGPLSDQTHGTAPITLNATATSGLTVKFASNGPSVCTVSGVKVTLVKTGTCSITANQPGNAVYAAAPSVTQTFTID